MAIWNIIIEYMKIADKLLSNLVSIRLWFPKMFVLVLNCHLSSLSITEYCITLTRTRHITAHSHFPTHDTNLIYSFLLGNSYGSLVYYETRTEYILIVPSLAWLTRRTAFSNSNTCTKLLWLSYTHILCICYFCHILSVLY